MILVVIGGLLVQPQRGLGGKPGLEHVGNECAAQLQIDGVGERQRRLAQLAPLERLATA